MKISQRVNLAVIAGGGTVLSMLCVAAAVAAPIWFNGWVGWVLCLAWLAAAGGVAFLFTQVWAIAEDPRPGRREGQTPLLRQVFGKRGDRGRSHTEGEEADRAELVEIRRRAEAMRRTARDWVSIPDADTRFDDVLIDPERAQAQQDRFEEREATDEQDY